MDIGKVEVPKQNTNPASKKQKYDLQAAQVAIVSSNYEVIYKENIYHTYGSFRINPHNRPGLSRDSLVGGKSLSTVQEEVPSILQGKLVIMMAAEGDLSSLGLTIADFDILDLEWNW